MAPEEQPGSLPRPLYFPMDAQIASELPWVTLRPPGKPGRAAGGLSGGLV